MPDPLGKPKNDNSASVEYFDINRQLWESAADLPFGLIKPAAGVVDGKIYVIGGQVDGCDNRAVLRLDPAQDRWDKITECPEPVRHPASCVLDGKIYFSGGASGKVQKVDGKKLVPMSRKAWAFDPGTQKFTALPDLIGPLAGHGMVGIDNKLYIFSGINERKEFAYNIEMLDLAKGGGWQVIDRLEKPRAIFEACVIGKDAYLASGWTHLHRDPNPTVACYHLQ
jgi:N-acetylneuraminic acid mutarotase